MIKASSDLGNLMKTPLYESTKSVNIDHASNIFWTTFAMSLWISQNLFYLIKAFSYFIWEQ